MNATFLKCLLQKKVDITNFCAGNSHFVCMREPTNAEMKTIASILKVVDKEDKEDDSAASTIEALEKFTSLLPTLITDHDFFDEEEKTKKLPCKDVAEFVSSKVEMGIFLIQEYMALLPLERKTAKK